MDKNAIACAAMVLLLLPCFAAARQVADRSLTLNYVDSMRTNARTASTLATAETPIRFTASSPDGARSLQLASWSSASLVELPRNEAPGTYSRPRYALGFRSDSMRLWLNGLGIEATNCLAPVVRLRSKMSSDGHLSGTLWLSARCDIR